MHNKIPFVPAKPYLTEQCAYTAGSFGVNLHKDFYHEAIFRFAYTSSHIHISEAGISLGLGTGVCMPSAGARRGTGNGAGYHKALQASTRLL